MPYGKTLVDTIESSGNLAITGNVTTSGTITSSTGTTYPLVSGTAQASTSGTLITFTSIPSWVKRITVMLNGVSTNGTSPPLIQIGSGSLTTSGYAGATTNQGASAQYTNATTGFQLGTGGAAANVLTGILFITLISGNTWVASGSFAYENVAFVSYSAGKIALSGVLDRVGITTVNGTDAFDTGSINILYE